MACLLRLVGLWTHIHTTTALPVQIVETIVTLFATGAILQVTLATLSQHALADDTGAHLFVAGVGHVGQEAHQDHGNEENGNEVVGDDTWASTAATGGDLRRGHGGGGVIVLCLLEGKDSTGDVGPGEE